jgi:hypothetical protein
MRLHHSWEGGSRHGRRLVSRRRYGHVSQGGGGGGYYCAAVRVFKYRQAAWPPGCLGCSGERWPPRVRQQLPRALLEDTRPQSRPTTGGPTCHTTNELGGAWKVEAFGLWLASALAARAAACFAWPGLGQRRVSAHPGPWTPRSRSRALNEAAKMYLITSQPCAMWQPRWFMRRAAAAGGGYLVAGCW